MGPAVEFWQTHGSTFQSGKFQNIFRLREIFDLNFEMLVLRHLAFQKIGGFRYRRFSPAARHQLAAHRHGRDARVPGAESERPGGHATPKEQVPGYGDVSSDGGRAPPWRPAAGGARGAAGLARRAGVVVSGEVVESGLTGFQLKDR